jgi:hypothetical protein
MYTAVRNLLEATSTRQKLAPSWDEEISDPGRASPRISRGGTDYYERAIYACSYVSMYFVHRVRTTRRGGRRPPGVTTDYGQTTPTHTPTHAHGRRTRTPPNCTVQPVVGGVTWPRHGHEGWTEGGCEGGRQLLFSLQLATWA